MSLGQKQTNKQTSSQLERKRATKKRAAAALLRLVDATTLASNELLSLVVWMWIELKASLNRPRCRGCAARPKIGAVQCNGSVQWEEPLISLIPHE